MKSYPGGFLLLAWSGSPKTMRGRSAPLIVCDEVDGYVVTPEGHPVSLLWQRAATFGDQRKLVEISTPTIKGASYVETAFLAGDQRRYFIRCPHCDHEQTLIWDNVTWTGKQSSDEDNLKLLDNHEPETARYTCASCGALLNDGERISAIRKGRWIAAKPFKGHASYHINEMYSTFRRLRDIVKSYLEKLAQGDLQTFYNVSLAETWEESGEVTLPSVIKARAEQYSAEVPDGVLYITCGVDAQQDRLELEVVGWGLNEESWSIEYRVLHGDTLGPEPWNELEEFLQTEFTCADGTVKRIESTVVDTGGTGGYTQVAYDWLKKKTGRAIFAGKGMGGWGKPIVAQPNRKYSGKDARKVDLYIVGVDEAKLVLMRRLRLDKPGTAGFCHFPIDREDEYYEQLTAEKLVSRFVKGFTVREWHKQRARNEALDCRVYAHAALKIKNPNLFRMSKKLNPTPAQEVTDVVDKKEQVPATPPAADDAAPAPTVPTPATKKRPKFGAGKSWASRW